MKNQLSKDNKMTNDKTWETKEVKTPGRMKPLEKAIKCKDGATVSIQGSESHYSTPRSNSGIYTHVEAGFPSVNPPESWLEYAEGDIDNSLSEIWRNIKRSFNTQSKFTRQHAVRALVAQIMGTMPQLIIYPYMPAELVYEFIDAHGGLEIKE